MIRLEKISLQFATQTIFKDANWHIRPNDRIGLVGPNGSGKTTLLKILLGKQLVDSGRIDKANGIHVGYLPQSSIQLHNTTLLHETLSVFQPLLEFEKEIHDLHQEISHLTKKGLSTPYRLKRLGYLQNLYEQSDGYRIESEAKKILMGLGFQEGDWTRPVTTFSTGWQMRISLAKLLLLKPNLLMLDEPTNHLDVQSTEWVESYLKKYEGAFILVSHDRYFLDRTVTKVISIEHFGLQKYPGNYSFFEKERQKRIEMQKKEYIQQQQEIERIQTFIDRFRYKATKAAQVQSRIKMVEKMNRIQLPKEDFSFRIRFPTAPPSGKLIVEAEDVAKNYGDKQVFSGVSFRCDRGDRIALVGVNGAGKSTLCKIIANKVTTNQGRLFRDDRLKIGYYSQEIADQLTGDKTVLEQAMFHAGNMDPKQVRNILGAFLFSGDDVFKQIHMLSGGEKSRLALACLLFSPANLFILDEPTNHLDLLSKDILVEALHDYEGSILLVSHDRYFVDKIVNRIIEISNGLICQYWGNYTDYLAKKEVEPDTEMNQVERSGISDNVKSMLTQKKSKDQKRLEAEERNKKFQLRKKHEVRLQKIELEITKLESKKENLEYHMSNPSNLEGHNIQKMQVEFHQTVTMLGKLYQEWEGIAEQIEKINEGTYS